MTNPAMETCCACLVTTPMSTMYSLADRDTLQLFQECTNISIPDDNQHMPQLICALCYKQCDMWECFKNRCQQNYKFKRSVSIIPDTDPEGEPHPLSQVVKEEPTEFETTGYHITSTIKQEPIEDGDNSDEEWTHPSSSQPPFEEILLPSYAGTSKVGFQEPAPHPEGRDKIPPQSRIKYVKSYLEYMQWKEESTTTTTSTEINEDSLLAYFEHQISLTTPGSLGPKFAHLKATMLAFQNIDIEHYGELRNYIRRVNSDYTRTSAPKILPHQLMQFFNVQMDLNVTKQVIVTLWISGIKQRDLFQLLIEDVRDKGGHIEVKGASQKYIIEPCANYKYDPLPLVRKYMDLVRRYSKDKLFIQKVVGKKIIPEKIGVHFIRQLAKHVAVKLNLPNPGKYSLKSLPQLR